MGSMTSGRADGSDEANQVPSALACSRPGSDSGTSTSRWVSVIRARPSACAASLPALCPWRTTHNVAGQRGLRLALFHVRDHRTCGRMQNGEASRIGMFPSRITQTSMRETDVGLGPDAAVHPANRRRTRGNVERRGGPSPNAAEQRADQPPGWVQRCRGPRYSKVKSSLPGWFGPSQAEQNSAHGGDPRPEPAVLAIAHHPAV